MMGAYETSLFCLKIQIAILCSSISKPLCIFSAQFTIYNSTFGTDNFQAHLHWWGKVSSCYSTCPSATPLLCVTKDFKLLYSKLACAHYGKHVPWPSLAFLRYQYICRQTSPSAHTPFLSMTTKLTFCWQWTSHLQICSWTWMYLLEQFAENFACLSNQHIWLG